LGYLEAKILDSTVRAAGDGGDDCQLVCILDGCVLLAFEVTDVVVVQINVDE
jgi:hypothetical protein